MHERRKNARWKLNKPARMRLEGATADTACVIQDINFNGIRICLKPRLPRDTFLKLKIILSREFVLDVEAWQVWHKTLNGHNVYGLYFSKISDSDKEEIYKFVYKLAPQEIASGAQIGVHIVEHPAIYPPHHIGLMGTPPLRRDWPVSTVVEGGVKMEDRRIFARFPAQLPVRLLDTRTGIQGKAQTQDVS
ncbi:MAG: PilZ domain-containing protein, partial [Candidatus Omnitrophota bacterium]